jgi:hypothetical protein
VSYDLLVYAKRRLDRDQLAALVHDARLGVEPNRGALTVVRGARRQYCFTLGEAVAVEAEDVPGEVTAVALASRWLYELLVEGSSATGTTHAIRFARRLAEAAQGVVLDQQTGQVWARGRLRAAAPAARGRADVVQLIWYTRDVDEPSDLAEQWLALACCSSRQACPVLRGTCPGAAAEGPPAATPCSCTAGRYSKRNGVTRCAGSSSRSPWAAGRSTLRRKWSATSSGLDAASATTARRSVRPTSRLVAAGLGCRRIRCGGRGSALTIGHWSSRTCRRRRSPRSREEFSSRPRAHRLTETNCRSRDGCQLTSSRVRTTVTRVWSTRH